MTWFLPTVWWQKSITQDRKRYRKSTDTSKAEALDGVVKVVTFKDVPNHCYPTPGHPRSVELAHQDVADRNILTGRVRYYGDDIAAVVAEDEITAQRALRLIEVEYEEYPVEIHPRKSMYGSKPPIHLEIKRTMYLSVPITLSEMWKKG